MRLALRAPLLAACALAFACSSLPPVHNASSALEFLYPEGRASAAAPRDVTLHLPVRVGLAFAPGNAYQASPITETQKKELLDNVAAAFKAHKGVGRLEVVPAVYLKPGGGFANLDQVATSLGLDLMVLVSWDQAQFTESTRASWTYLTVIGPLLIEGEKNDTRTLMDAVVYDIPSRSLLFRAAGDSTIHGRSSPLNEAGKRRKFAEEGFDQATRSLIASLDTALAGFETTSKEGTVRGPGTPAIAIYDKSGTRVNQTASGGGAGALGGSELGAAVLLALALLARRPARDGARGAG
jgi:rhombotail lipoprotein